MPEKVSRKCLAATFGLDDAIVRLDPAGLHLLPGGKPRDDVAELLSGPTYARVLTEARRMFDYIIIDAPPLGIFTDANVLMSRADGALLVVRAGKTRYCARRQAARTDPAREVCWVWYSIVQTNSPIRPITTTSIAIQNREPLNKRPQAANRCRRTSSRRGGCSSELRVLRVNGRTMVLLSLARQHWSTARSSALFTCASALTTPISSWS